MLQKKKKNVWLEIPNEALKNYKEKIVKFSNLKRKPNEITNYDRTMNDEWLIGKNDILNGKWWKK